MSGVAWLALAFVAGLVLLVLGGEWLVRGASRLAARLGVPSLVIGLTVVAFGTSAPELAVTVGAAVSGGPAADLALGNVVGSNIFNVLFILGISALVTPLAVNLRMVRLEVPVMIAVSVLCLVLIANGHVGRAEGLLLVAGLVAYTVFTLVQSRAAASADDAAPTGTGAVWRQLLLIVGGLVVLVVGSRLLLHGAVGAARLIGVSETVIGLTIVAAGTSLPELTTSVLAGLRGERDIAVGNVVGSNIFNILGVLGLAAVIAPAGVIAPPAVIAFDGWVMLAVAALCLPVFFTGYRIERWEGGLFLLYYLAYSAWLILDATGHDALPAFSGVMLWGVLPLTVLTLVVSLRRRSTG
ncbi:calcium/sodium antiporter [Sediminicurvatus halobius]|uniref:Sodium:calcium antiporter n=1 Tax=Sediminicurvatus halobius TaxID=2182432 RepID=A0A2U2N057_9GAMM|nr:calcium/sodium antiporter [Spiribacter halobius]PWG62566.1 sodium:calcium antiporter [Spiribacter halobius]UEX78520.1 calcium/sodium antiporter [Spiribacter halobius]